MHIFYEHLLQPQNLKPVIKITQEQVWPSIYLFLCLGLLTLIKFSSFPKVLRIVQSTFSPQVLQQLEREEANPFKFYSIGLNLIFLLNVSFLIYKINTLYKSVLIEERYFVQFSFFVMVVILSFLLKTFITRLLAVFTDKRKVISDYLISSSLVNQSFGLFLFPFIVLLEFSPLDPVIFVSGALIVLAASFLLKWYRGIVMGLVEERLGLLQIFSYFCGLEILPVCVLVKYIIETL